MFQAAVDLFAEVVEIAIPFAFAFALGSKIFHMILDLSLGRRGEW